VAANARAAISGARREMAPWLQLAFVVVALCAVAYAYRTDGAAVALGTALALCAIAGGYAAYGGGGAAAAALAALCTASAARALRPQWFAVAGGGGAAPGALAGSRAPSTAGEQAAQLAHIADEIEAGVLSVT